jgi:mannose-1-phosphate guanylyltransferase
LAGPVKALVLIGGFGTRLRPITYTVPKQLIPLAGKSMLYHVFDLIPRDVEEVVLATGYKADVVEAFVREHPTPWPVRTVPETDPLGTGGGMKNASEGLSDPFYLLNSDVVTSVDLAALRDLHLHRGGVGTMALAEVEDTRPYGVAALGPDDRIDAFVEKPEPKDAPSHWINAGLAVWNASVLDRIPAGRAVSFEREVVPGLLPEGLYGYRLHKYWDDAGTPERLLNAQQLLFEDGRGGKGGVPPGALGSGPVAAASGVRAEGASFGKYVTLGENVTVEPGAQVENSILMAGAFVEREAVVRSSLLGPGVIVRAGHPVVGQVLGAGVVVGEATTPGR